MTNVVWKKKYIISPSLITLDLCNLERDVKHLEAAGIQMLHVDILDGYFSPSMPLGIDTVRRLRQLTDLPFDVHLMANDNEFFIDELLDIGVEQLLFHIETETHVDYVINKIKKSGARSGVALKPGTPISDLEYVLEICDTVLVMLINPGYAQEKSQGAIEYCKRKLYDLREMIVRKNLDTKIEIDGRVSKDLIREFGEEIVDIFVAGSTCLNLDNLEESAKDLLEEFN